MHITGAALINKGTDSILQGGDNSFMGRQMAKV